jgi:hypothetical protein
MRRAVFDKHVQTIREVLLRNQRLQDKEEAAAD